MGAIVGWVVGGVAVLSLLTGIFFLVWRRRSKAMHSVLTQRVDPSREAILTGASPLARTPGVTPFLNIDPSLPPASASAADLSSSEHWTAREADTKRAYRLRRIPNEELQQRATMVDGPPSSATYPSTSPSAFSNQSDPAFGQGLLQEISNLRREISAMRMSDGMTAPPEYDA